MPPVEARPAATVIVARPGDHGPEILLIRRSRELGFFPQAWVFPGGRVELADAQVAVRGRVAGLPEPDRAFGVAAIRECFEETGVWLGAPAPPATLRQDLAQRRASLVELAPGVVADLDQLSLWSWWITPESEPRRFDTRFFLSLLAEDDRPEVEPDGVETVQSAWMGAQEALARAAEGALFLAPPTFRTLEELAPHRDLAALRAAAEARHASGRGLRPIAPLMCPDLPGSDGMAILLPGDPLHPDPWAVEGGTRIVLRGGRWVSEVG